MSEIPETKG